MVCLAHQSQFVLLNISSIRHGWTVVRLSRAGEHHSFKWTCLHQVAFKVFDWWILPFSPLLLSLVMTLGNPRDQVIPQKKGKGRPWCAVFSAGSDFASVQATLVLWEQRESCLCFTSGTAALGEELLIPKPWISSCLGNCTASCVSLKRTWGFGFVSVLFSQPPLNNPCHADGGMPRSRAAAFQHWEQRLSCVGYLLPHTFSSLG